MKLKKTKINGLYILEPNYIEDQRGYFVECYNKNKIDSLIGDICFVQDNESRSSKGTLRGLHFQKPPFSQSKLIRCIEGEILDVAVDLRKKSNTFGQHSTNYLNEKNNNQVFIPKGFAHGFIVLSDFAKIIYKVDNFYNPDYESGIIWNDKTLNIDWKINPSEIILSNKDKYLLSFDKINSPF